MMSNVATSGIMTLPRIAQNRRNHVATTAAAIVC